MEALEMPDIMFLRNSGNGGEFEPAEVTSEGCPCELLFFDDLRNPVKGNAPENLSFHD